MSRCQFIFPSGGLFGQAQWWLTSSYGVKCQVVYLASLFFFGLRFSLGGADLGITGTPPATE